MDVSHNFRFRWNDHVPHLSQIFSELRFDEVYCDTTLISDDGFVLKAHGAVLSATSRYFERVLSDVTADQHPIIVLKGAYFTELSCLLDYIYEGVTQVDQHMMESVLDVADMLEIKGLSKMKNNLSIKKLIAPSPPSSVVSRSSPQCSSPSKSPTPPSHTPCTHSPSCPSSPNESYVPPSAMLKMDSEDPNELSDPTQKKRLSFHDAKTPMGTSLMESKEYAASTASNAPSHSAVCPSADYSDQTLGIDLSLSRPTNEDSERGSVKNFSLHEDTPLRKRKIMKYEEFSPQPNDSDWVKGVEKVKESMPHKKKKILTRSVTHVKNSRSCSQEETHKATSHFTLEKLASMLSKDKGEGMSLNDTSPSRNLALAPKHKQKSSSSVHPDRSESEDSSMEVAMDSQVEVLCSDGALTISVTTESAHQTSLKNLNSFNGAHVSLSLKKAKKRYRYKRQMEAVKKESTEERKNCPRVVLKRPNTRFFKRLKSHGVQSQSSHRSESLSIHCDPPFPTEDAVQQSSLNKDKSPSSLVLHVEEDKSEKEKSTREDDGSDSFTGQSRPLGKDCEEKSRGFSCISPLTLFTLPPVKEREKQTRTSLTLEEKIKVIEAFLDGKSQRQIAHLYGIGKTQVNGIVKKREEILSLYRESLVRGEKLTMKRQRKSEYASLNEHLIKWYRHMTVVAGMKITTGMLRAKALQIAPQLGYHDFKASNGWLATFKANHNLKFSRAKKPSESYSNENYDEGEAQKEGEFFEDEVEEGTDMTAATITQTSGSSSSSSSSSAASGEAVNVHSVGLHLGTMRGDPDSEIVSSGQPPPVGNLTLGNSLLSGSAPLPKPPQMSNMALGTNIAYNLAREHPRSDLTHLSDLHSAPAVNAPPSLAHPPHPPLAKPPDGPLSYKTEDSLSYGYDTQGRMNEGSARGTEYNYTHYGFPSTYYGYHFLGQY